MVSKCNPQLFIIDFFNSLINQIDIYTEEKLEKLGSDDLISPSSLSTSEVNKNVKSGDRYIQEFKVPKFNEIQEPAIIDPYTQFSYDEKIASRPLLFNPESSPIKSIDYFNRIREELIQELEKMQKECLDNYNQSRKQETNLDWLKDISEEDLKKKLFAKKSCFILNFDSSWIPQKSSQSSFYHFSKYNIYDNNNTSPYGVYLFVFDFYIEVDLTYLIR